MSIGWVICPPENKRKHHRNGQISRRRLTHSKILEIRVPFQILQYRLNERLNVLF